MSISSNTVSKEFHFKDKRVIAMHYEPDFWVEVSKSLGGIAFSAEQAYDQTRKHVELFGRKSRSYVARDFRVINDLTPNQLLEYFQVIAEVKDAKSMSKRLLIELKRIDAQIDKEFNVSDKRNSPQKKQSNSLKSTKTI